MAVYNRAKGFLYHHIFRTGGNSMRRVFEGSSILGAHPTAHDVMRYFESKGWKNFWDEAHKFIVVRNPFDWMVSVQQYIVQRPNHGFHRTIKGKDMAFYLRWYRSKMEEGQPCGANAYATLSGYCCDPDGNMLVDQVVRFENMGGVVGALRKRFGITKVLPHENRTQRKRGHRSYYNAESKKLVEEIFAEDLERFKYVF